MRSVLTKIINCILIASVLLSCIIIPTYADEEESTTPEPELLLYRTFDEGWDVTNGFSVNAKNNPFGIEYESDLLGNFNYYYRNEFTNDEGGYFQMDIKTKSPIGYVLEFDMKSPDNLNIGNCLQVRHWMDTNSSAWIMNVTGNRLTMLGDSANAIDLGHDWVHVTLVFDYSDIDGVPVTESNRYRVHAYYGEDSYSTAILTGGASGVDASMFRFQTLKQSGLVGQSVLYDNIALYTGNELMELDGTEHGRLVSNNATKPIEILGAAAENNRFNGLYFKLGCEYSLLNNEKTPILTAEDGTVYGAPFMDGDNVYIPLHLLFTYLSVDPYYHSDGQTITVPLYGSSVNLFVGRSDAVVDGVRVSLSAPIRVVKEGDYDSYPVVCIDDISKLFSTLYVDFDTMGLVGISTVDFEFDRINKLHEMLDIMKAFIFDYATAEQIYDDLKTATNNFDHPYLVAKDEDFERLREYYYAEEDDGTYDPLLKKSIEAIIKRANQYFAAYAITYPDGSYKCFNEANKPVNKHYDPTYEEYSPDGYDPYGGRLNVPVECTYYTAFAYRITGDIKYAYMVYDYMLALGEWPHWAPAHFLNCADASFPFAIAFDWMYDINEALGLSNEALAEILFSHGVHQGWLGCNNIPTPYPRKKIDASHYNIAEQRRNNWNAVCSSGMVIASFAIMQYDQYKEEATWLCNNNINLLIKYGLDEYAPDGSYVESQSYWSYGTNAFFRLCLCLDTAIGDTYGLMECWGIESTSYFAMQIESSDYSAWGYNDGGSGSVDQCMFFFTAEYFNDPVLYKHRVTKLNAQKKTGTLWDILKFPTNDMLGEDVVLPTTYYMEGIDAVTIRDSWESGALFTGIMGGPNDCPHNHIDSGAFVYYNEGIQWIYDLGSDNYNIYQYMGDNPRSYRRSPEGHNVVMLTSQQDEHLPYGQVISARGYMYGVYENEHGSVAYVDNTEAYAPYAMYATRGIMVTNDKKTTVLQDEISFTGIQTVCWFAHTSTNISLSSDKKTAYFTANGANGATLTMRATLVSKIKSIRFSIMDTYTFVLDRTYRPGDSEALGGRPENSREGISKLAIIAEDVLTFNVAVVFEVIDTKNEIEVGYEYVDMADWVPTADSRTAIDDGTPNRLSYKLSNIASSVTAAQRLIDQGSFMTNKFKEYYRYLADVGYIRSLYNVSNLSGSMKEYYDSYLEMESAYNSYVTKANERLRFPAKMLGSSALIGEEA